MRLVATKSKILSVAILVTCVALVGCVQQEPAQPPRDADEVSFEEVWTDGVLQPLSDGFPSQPIVLVNPDEAGSRDGTYARAVADALAPVVPVDVTVANEQSSQGTFPAIVDTLQQPGGIDGNRLMVLSIPGAVSDFHVEPLEAQLGRTLADFVMVRTTETQPFIMAQRSDSPWGDTFEEFVTWAQSHPGEIRYAASTVGSGLDIAMEWLLDQLDISVEKIPTGSAAAAVATVASGEADITMSNVDLGRPAIDLGRIEVLWVSTDTVPAAWARPGVANAGDGELYGYADKPRWGSVMTVAVAAEVPQSHIDWLEAALEAAAASRQYSDHLKTIYGAELYSLTSEESNALAQATYDSTGPLIDRLGLGWR